MKFFTSDWRQKLTQYGGAGLAVYFGIFFLVWGGFILAIEVGWKSQSAAGSAGVITAAYLATKVTQPLRIAATVVLAPLVHRLWTQLRRPKANA